MISQQATADWPSEQFELIWSEVASAAPPGSFTSEYVAGVPVITTPDWAKIPVGAWVHLTGRLEQRTPMGAVHPDGEEWFVRTSAGDPIAAYVMTHQNFSVGSFVALLGRDAGSISLMNRAGVLQRYPAVIARPLERAAAHTLHPASRAALGDLPVGFVAVGGVLVLLVGWFFVRMFSKRAGSRGMSKIHAVADRARAQEYRS